MARRIPAGLRSGQTLFELMLATALTAAALASTLSLTRKCLKMSREIETRQLVNNYAVSKLEEHLALGAALWTDTTATGTLSGDGYSGIRFRAVRSQAPADGGIADQLMSVNVTVWEDTDSDSVVDSTEYQSTMRSKIAKTANYQAKAGG